MQRAARKALEILDLSDEAVIDAHSVGAKNCAVWRVIQDGTIGAGR